MARSRARGLVALVLLGTVGCTTEQPLQTGSQVLRVMPFTASATYPVLCYQDVWDVFADQNGNGQADPGECVGLECGDFSCPSTPSVRAVPWGYTVEIVVIRAGQVVRTVVTPSGAASGSILSVTEGDPDFTANQSPPPPAPPGRFHRNPRALPETNLQWVQWCSGFLNVPGANLAGRSDPDPNDPGICGSPTPSPWDIEVQSGDTVIVNAGFANDSVGPYTGPNFNGSMTLDGQPITPNGITFGSEPGAHLSFSYTVR